MTAKSSNDDDDDDDDDEVMTYQAITELVTLSFSCLPCLIFCLT